MVWNLLKLPAHLRTGRHGEAIAAREIARRGCTILARNVRVGPKDEIDIIALDPRDDVVVFVEVKTRSADDGYAPGIACNHRKRAAMLRAARQWVDSHGDERGYRFDVVCVVAGRVSEYWEDITADAPTTEQEP